MKHDSVLPLRFQTNPPKYPFLPTQLVSVVPYQHKLPHQPAVLCFKKIARNHNLSLGTEIGITDKFVWRSF